MLRLPAFEYAAPDTVDEVLALLADKPGRARLVAGGTDLIPNLKHGIEEADLVVSLKRVQGRQIGGLCRRPPRSGRLAWLQGPGDPGQHHAPAPAATLTRA